MTSLHFLPLSGQDEIGSGCYALIIDEDIILFDAAAKQPYRNTLGIKKIFPDTNWLNLNKHRVKGIFLGEPSSLTTDALLYLVNKINPKLPVYTSELGKVFIESNFNYEIKKMYPNFTFNFRILEPKVPAYVGTHKVIPFSTFTPVPLSLGFLIKDLEGDVVFVNNFILYDDFSHLYNNSLSDLPSLTRNVKLLVVGAGNVSYSKGFTTPGFQVRDFFLEKVQNSKGRVVVSIYENDLYYLYVLATVAKQTHRPFIVYSLSGVNVFSSSIKMKLFSSSNLVTLPVSEMQKSDNAIIVIIARISELNPVLMDIVNEEDKKLVPKSNDLFILATPRISGLEKIEADTIDAFTKSEIEITKLPKTVLPIKASVEDQKYLIKLLRPKNVVPINGLYRNFVDYTNFVLATGININAIHILDNGEVLDVNNPKAKHEKIQISEKYVGDISYYNEIDYPVLFERERMSRDGFADLTVLFNINNNKISLLNFELRLIGVVDKTFIASSKYKEMLEELKKKILIYFDSLKGADYEAKEFKNSLKKITEKYLEKQLNKKPLVLTVISQINSKILNKTVQSE